MAAFRKKKQDGEDGEGRDPNRFERAAQEEAAAQRRESLRQASSQLLNLDAQMRDISARMREANAQIRDVNSELRELNAQRRSLTSRLLALEEERDAVDARCDEISASKMGLQEERDGLLDIMCSQLARREQLEVDFELREEPDMEAAELDARFKEIDAELKALDEEWNAQLDEKGRIEADSAEASKRATETVQERDAVVTRRSELIAGLDELNEEVKGVQARMQKLMPALQNLAGIPAEGKSQMN